MPKLLCTLPNASEEISGIKFVSHAAGMLSEDVSDEQAAKFASIPGYEIVGATQPKDLKDPSADDEAKAAERAVLVERADAAGLRVKGNWSIERLRTEVETAEKAKAAEGAEQA